MQALGSRLSARRWLIALAALISAAAALSVLFNVEGSGLTTKQTAVGVGTAQLLVDSEPSTLATLNSSSNADTLSGRAPLYAEYGTGTAIKDQIARRAGLSPSSLTVLASTDETSGLSSTNTPSIAATGNYVTLSATTLNPVVDITSQAATASEAQRLASATSSVLVASIAQLAASQQSTLPATLKKTGTIVLRPLGASIGATAIQRPSKKKAISIGVVVFIVLLLVILALDNALGLRRNARRTSAA